MELGGTRIRGGTICIRHMEHESRRVLRKIRKIRKMVELWVQVHVGWGSMHVAGIGCKWPVKYDVDGEHGRSCRSGLKFVNAYELRMTSSRRRLSYLVDELESRIGDPGNSRR
jgi:hypothetical protein